MSRRVLLVCAAVAMVAAVLLAVSGGLRFTVGGVRVSARSPLPLALVGVALLASWTWLTSRGGSGAASRNLIDLWGALDRSAQTVVLCVALASGGAAVASGTFSAAGADASGYLSQAAMWATGRLRLKDGLPLMAGWPVDAGISAPLGWNASLERGWQVPTYGPGLPLLMAAPVAIGGPLLACLVVAFSAMLTIVATGAIAIRLAGGTAGIVAAIALATCPVFLFQSTQPMSDVPVTAAWATCWVLLIVPDRRRVLPAGIACAIAVLIRPNLAPLAIVPFLYLFLALRRTTLGTPGTFGTQPGTRGTLGTLGTFAAPVALAGLFLAWLQWQWYGSPLRSGYGTVEQLYSFAYIGPNASRYATWLISTSPILLLALAGVWAGRQVATWALAAFAVLNVAAYLVYFVFEEWSYLRFVLPALAVASVLVGVSIAALVHRVHASARAGLLLAVVLAAGGAGLARARALDVFVLADSHRRILQIDRYLDSVLQPGAVILSGEQSGAVRFDTGHAVVRWEAVSREDLTRVLSILDGEGRPVWILLDAWEEPLVRAKFAGIDTASLDWPPAVDAGDSHRTRAWRLSDRTRYLKGERIVTDRLR